MTPLQIELTKLIGKKDLSFGCIVDDIYRYIGSDQMDYMDAAGYLHDYIEPTEIIGHPATLSDLHRWLKKNLDSWSHFPVLITVYPKKENSVSIPYDSNKDLLDQSPETLTQIIELIKKYS